MERTILIKKAFTFEIKAIEHGSTMNNPYFKEIKTFKDGKEVLEAINLAVSGFYCWKEIEA